MSIYTDADEVYLALVPDALEEHSTYDDDEVYLTLTPSSDDVYVRAYPFVLPSRFMAAWQVVSFTKSLDIPFRIQENWEVRYFGKALS